MQLRLGGACKVFRQAIHADTTGLVAHLAVTRVSAMILVHPCVLRQCAYKPLPPLVSRNTPPFSRPASSTVFLACIASSIHHFYSLQTLAVSLIPYIISIPYNLHPPKSPNTYPTMHFSGLSAAGIAAALFSGYAAAQSSSDAPPSATPTPREGDVMIHVVQVGDAEGMKKFYPEKITAQPGELIQFQFYPSVCLAGSRVIKRFGMI